MESHASMKRLSLWPGQLSSTNVEMSVHVKDGAFPHGLRHDTRPAISAESAGLERCERSRRGFHERGDGG